MLDQSSPAPVSPHPLALLLEQDVSAHVAGGKSLDFRGLLACVWDRLRSEAVQYLDVAPLVEMAEKLYDEHVAPLDIPGVPNLIEPRVDAAIRAQIRPLIYKMLEAVRA